MQIVSCILAIHTKKRNYSKFSLMTYGIMYAYVTGIHLQMLEESSKDMSLIALCHPSSSCVWTHLLRHAKS
jgi:hypothetical protein